MIIDMHCDSILAAYVNRYSLAEQSQNGHLDLHRLRQAGVKIQFFALFPGIAPYMNPLQQVLLLGDFFWEQLASEGVYWDVITFGRQLLDVLHGEKSGAILTVEGGEALLGNIRLLSVLYRFGVRSLCLTWNNRNEIADGVDETKTGGGLTSFGRDVVKEMNRLGMLIDVSHLSERGFWDVLELSEAPIIASHSNCKAVWDHPRNLTDDQIRGIAQKGGIVGINFVAELVGPPGCGLEYLYRHIDHISSLVGDDYLGFGSDFDGTERLVRGVKDVNSFQEIIAMLIKNGYSEATLRKICSDNCVRLLRQVLL